MAPALSLAAAFDIESSAGASGGTVTISVGSGAGDMDGGNVDILEGAIASGSGTCGMATLTGGAGYAAGGSIELAGGQGTSSIGGNVDVTSGASASTASGNVFLLIFFGIIWFKRFWSR
jgi:hypothetical protein